MHGQEVRFRDGCSVYTARGVFTERFDGAADVGDLVAAAQEAVGAVWEVVFPKLQADGVGWVDVAVFDGAAEGGFGWVAG